MDRGQPEINRLVHKRQVDVMRRVHRDKLRQATSMVDNNAPLSTKYNRCDAKKVQLEDGKYSLSTC